MTAEEIRESRVAILQALQSLHQDGEFEIERIVADRETLFVLFEIAAQVAELNETLAAQRPGRTIELRCAKCRGIDEYPKRLAGQVAVCTNCEESHVLETV